VANKAAFSREDVADAKRGAPAVSLAGYAADRGLQFLDHATPAGYRTAVPCEPEFQFNLMRGPLPGGEFGVVGHEAFGLPWVGGTVAWSGWVETVGRPKGTGLRARDFALSMLPGADLFQYLADDMSEFMTSRAFADEITRELATGRQQPDVDVATILNATREAKVALEQEVAASATNYRVLPIQISSRGLRVGGHL